MPTLPINSQLPYHSPSFFLQFTGKGFLHHLHIKGSSKIVEFFFSVYFTRKALLKETSLFRSWFHFSSLASFHKQQQHSHPTDCKQHCMYIEYLIVLCKCFSRRGADVVAGRGRWNLSGNLARTRARLSTDKKMSFSQHHPLI